MVVVFSTNLWILATISELLKTQTLSGRVFVLVRHPGTERFIFPCCQSSTASKFDPTQLLPLRKCIPIIGQVLGQCGQAVMVPHITKVLWCQHNHIVCTVTTFWRDAVFGQFFPIYGVLYVRKWMMARYVLYAAKCVLLLHIQYFLTHTHALNLSSLMTSWWISYVFHLSQIG